MFKKSKEEVERVIKKYRQELMSKKGVVACFTGLKKVRGKETATWAIVCLVEEKLEAQMISKGEHIPSEIEGVPTDVVETGKIKPLKTEPEE